MLEAVRRTGTLALAIAAIALSPSPGQAAPLGLSPGDLVTTIEWDAINGGVFTLPDAFTIDGAVNSVTLSGPSTVVQTNVDFHADLQLVSESLNTLGAPIVQVNILFGSPGANPDLVIKENGINVLLANFSSSVVAGGNLNLNDTNAVFTAIGKVTVIGGDPNLVAALGGAGLGQANLLLTASLFDFNPHPSVLIADGQLFNSNFNLSLSGTLIPLTSQPFVPEPSTALLLGGGLVALLGASRRARARGR